MVPEVFWVVRRLFAIAFLTLAGLVPTTGSAQTDVLSRAPSRFANLDGVRIHYKSLHTGRTAVVFVHGWACDLTVWRLQMAPLDERVRVLALDLPGHGRSDKPVRPYSMEFYARAVNAVMAAAGVDRAILVGHSMGTPIVRQFYRLFPAKTIGLLLVDGSLKPPGLDSAAIERQVKQFSGPGLAQVWEQMIPPLLPGADLEPVRRQLIRTAQSTPEAVVTGSIRGMMDPKIWTADTIRVPVLAVMAKGPNWPPAYHAYVKGLVPDLRYEELDGVHHFLMLERPDLFNPLMVSFLKDQGLLEH